MGNGTQRPCCQPELSLGEEGLEGSAQMRPTLQFSPEALDRIRKRQISMEDAKVLNLDAIAKLKQHSLASTEAPEPSQDDYLKRLRETPPGGKQLRLKVLSSTSLQKFSIITISPLGCEGSLRGVQDGCTYFGNEQSEDGMERNDLVIPLEGGQKQTGRHFVIRFDLATETYYLKDLGQGLGCFIRLERPMPLKDSMLIHIGESFLLANILPRLTLRKFPRLRIMLYGGNCTGEVFYFNATEYYDKKIRIGRLPTCEIRVDDSLISKVQACVFFSTGEGWVLADGDMDQQRASTNGTWLYAGSEVEVYSGLVFKASQSLFQALLV